MPKCITCHTRKKIEGAARCNHCGVQHRIDERERGGYEARSKSGRGRPTKYTPKHK